MFSNQVLKSPMTPRLPERESGAFLNANCSNLTLIGRKLISLCYRNGFQPSFEILNDFQMSTTRIWSTFLCQLLQFYPNWMEILITFSFRNVFLPSFEIFNDSQGIQNTNLEQFSMPIFCSNLTLIGQEFGNFWLQKRFLTKF